MALDEQMLSRLLDAAIPDYLAHKHLDITVVMRTRGRDELPGSFQALLAFIDAAPELELFRGGEYRLAGSGGTATPALLLGFLLGSAARNSPAVAVAQLQGYLAATEIPCIRRTLITGVIAAAPFQLDANTRFIPLHRHFDDGDPILQEEVQRMESSYGVSRPMGILEAGVTIPRIHVAAGAPIPGDPLTADARAPVMALQLVCSSAVFGPMTWHHVPPWVFGAPSGTRYYQLLPERTLIHQLSDGDIAEAQALQERLTALPPADFDLLWLMVHRLSLAQSHKQLAENAIDLRIAYEMTFFFGEDTGGYQGELKFRLALHASRLLRKSHEDREVIRAAGNALYRISSAVIHSGRVPQQYAKAAPDVLRNGAGIVREGLKYIVLNGAPDWQRLLLE